MYNKIVLTPEELNKLLAQAREEGMKEATHEWFTIETAPCKPWDFVYLAWGTEEDKTTGIGCFRDGAWIASAIFYCINKPRDTAWEMRETVVTPTHWMPLPAAPSHASLNAKEGGE